METLEKLISKSDESKSPTWKWVLGIVIALIIVYIEWKLKNQSTKIELLEAERALVKEEILDLQVKLENEKNTARVEEYKDEISDLRVAVAYRAVKLIQIKKVYKEKVDRVNQAKKWKDLEELAGRR